MPIDLAKAMPLASGCHSGSIGRLGLRRLLGCPAPASANRLPRDIPGGSLGVVLGVNKGLAEPGSGVGGTWFRGPRRLGAERGSGVAPERGSGVVARVTSV